MLIIVLLLNGKICLHRFNICIIFFIFSLSRSVSCLIFCVLLILCLFNCRVNVYFFVTIVLLLLKSLLITLSSFELICVHKIFLEIRTILFLLIFTFAIRIITIFGFGFILYFRVRTIVSGCFRFVSNSIPVKSVWWIACSSCQMRHSLSDLFCFNSLILQKLIVF